MRPVKFFEYSAKGFFVHPNTIVFYFYFKCIARSLCSDLYPEVIFGVFYRIIQQVTHQVSKVYIIRHQYIVCCCEIYIQLPFLFGHLQINIV